MAVVIVSVHVITVLFVLGMDPFCDLNRDYIHNILGVLCILGRVSCQKLPFHMEHYTCFHQANSAGAAYGV